MSLEALTDNLPVKEKAMEIMEPNILNQRLEHSKAESSRRFLKRGDYDFIQLPLSDAGS